MDLAARTILAIMFLARQSYPWLVYPIAVFLTPLAAQTDHIMSDHTMSDHAMSENTMSENTMGTEKQTPPADLPVPQKLTGIGNAHIRITANAEAQMWFDQGLNLLHDFWDYESARAFEQSVRVDPQCAMCYWGLFEAESFYHGLAQGYAAPALASAVKLKSRASHHERLYIDATVALEDARESDKPQPALAKDLLIWRKLAKDDPNDIQAPIFLAERVDMKEKLAILEGILKSDPNNSAANHYYIHALEAGPHPEQALHSAEILASLAPASGHMVHMPGHIFYRMGDYARAEQAFAASALVDQNYMHDQHVQPDNDWNYVHNLMYAIANLMEEGKLNQATALSGKLTVARGELESTLYTYSTRDSISRLDPRLPVALRTADWKQVIELLQTNSSRGKPGSFPNLEFLSKQLSTFAAGMQGVEAHDLTKAEASSSQFDAGLWRMSQQPRNVVASAPANPPVLRIMPDAELPPLMSTLSIMSLELRASLLAAQAKPTEAHSLFVKAAQAEKALGYREPPVYVRPGGETEAAAMMAAGAWSDARAAYEQALLERPRSGFALYGIAMSSEKSGDSAAAGKEYADFLKAWKDADATLPQMTHAKSYAH